jgi:hypothetical protein
MRMTRSRTAAVVALLVAALLAGACSVGGDPSAPYFPKTKPVASTPLPIDASLNVPAAPLVTAMGPVSRPNSRVTPGVIASHDVAAICSGASKSVHPTIPAAWDVAVFGGYGIAAKDEGKYRLDYLVPLTLGGGDAVANLWPVTLRPVGFHEKARLNARLRLAVCQGEVPLDQAQHDIVADWYTLWVRYGA